MMGFFVRYASVAKKSSMASWRGIIVTIARMLFSALQWRAAHM
jgi:hypothetical protein